MSDHAQQAGTRVAVVLVLATSLSVGAWVVHLTALASLVDASRTSDGASVAMNLLTAFAALVCAGVVALGAWHVHLTSPTNEGEGTPIGRTAFLAWLAVVLGATNLLLVLFEGSYVLLINRHA